MKSLGRVGHAAKSPLHPVEAVVARLKEQLLDVRRESEALLQKRIRDVLEINLRIEKELKDVQSKLEGTSTCLVNAGSRLSLAN